MALPLLVMAVWGFADSTGNAAAQAENAATVREAKYTDAGDNPQTARDFQLLGEEYVRGGKLTDALQALARSSELKGDTDPETLKRLATIGGWTRRFTDADQWLQKAVRLAPEDHEAVSALQNLRFQRSLHILGSAGGWDVDYVSRATEVGAFVGWVDWLDLYGGYSRVDKIFYRRNDLWADAYFFFEYQFSVRLGGRIKKYEYPVSLSATPDQSAYADVPDVQIEGTYAIDEGNTLSLELEYFTPNFYWNNSLRADNTKITVSVQHWLLHPFYAKIFAALLKDPDPSSFIADPATQSVLSFGYEKTSLFGGALGLDDGRLKAEIKYVPDRDLDRSIGWSIFGRIRYEFDSFGVQYDMLYDRYSQLSSPDLAASHVNMFTLLLSPLRGLEIRAGAKVLTKERTDLAPFLYIRLRTGF